jgi:hypothetical protein
MHQLVETKPLGPTISFRSISSVESHNQLVKFLTDDVIKHGGSASETVDMHGQLWEITVCKVPWGTLLLKQEVSKLEAFISFFNSD